MKTIIKILICIFVVCFMAGAKSTEKIISMSGNSNLYFYDKKTGPFERYCSILIKNSDGVDKCYTPEDIVDMIKRFEQHEARIKQLEKQINCLRVSVVCDKDGNSIPYKVNP